MSSSVGTAIGYSMSGCSRLWVQYPSDQMLPPFFFLIWWPEWPLELVNWHDVTMWKTILGNFCMRFPIRGTMGITVLVSKRSQHYMLPLLLGEGVIISWPGRNHHYSTKRISNVCTARNWSDYQSWSKKKFRLKCNCFQKRFYYLP